MLLLSIYYSVSNILNLGKEPHKCSCWCEMTLALLFDFICTVWKLFFPIGSHAVAQTNLDSRPSCLSLQRAEFIAVSNFNNDN